MKYNTRNSLLNKLNLGILVAMANEGGGSAGTLLTFEDLKDLDIDDISGLSLGEIADAAGFPVPPLGHYQLRLEIDFGEQGQGDKAVKCIAATWEIVETVELVNPENDVPLPPGTKFTQNWAGGGVQFFKTNFGKVAVERGATNETTIAQLLPLLNGILVTADVTHRKDKEKTDDKGKPRVYPGVTNITLIPTK
jgi:hypothetical protein